MDREFGDARAPGARNAGRSKARGFLVLLRSFAVLAVLAVQGIAGPVLAADTPAAAAKATVLKSDTVGVRVWPHKDYGRIVFDWPRAVPFKAKQTNRALSIGFDRPFTAKLDEIPARLGTYAVAARPGEDGRSVLVTLKPGVRFKTFTSGNSLVVDLVPAKAPPAQNGDIVTVPVRIGTHATFNRFVFDWHKAVDYDVVTKGGETLVRFNRAARFDLAAVQRDLPPFVRAVSQRPGAAATLAFRLVSGATVRHFRSGTSVVVDVLIPAGATKAENKAAARKPRAKAGMPPVKPARREPVAVLDMNGAAGARTGSHTAPVSEAAPTSLLPGASAAAARSAIPVILTVDPTMATIKFHWPEAVGAAVFTRAGYLWAVFDREARFTFEGWDEALKKPSPNSKRIPDVKPATAFIARPKFSSMPGTSVFRMKVPDGVNPHVARDGAAWVVTLEREYLKPAIGVTVESHLAAAAGARLFLSTEDAGQAVAINDPEVGDRVWVVPLTQAGKGIGLARTYADVQLFATAQGVAGRSVSDHITFRTLPKGVEINSRTGLTLSGVSLVAGRADGPETDKKATPGQTRPGWLFDIQSWRRPGTGGFIENKHILQRAAAMAPPTTRNSARLQLAQLDFAYDNFTDVLGILQVIEQDEPELAQDPNFRALRGGAYYRLEDYDRAALDLNDPSLDSYKEVALWRAGLAAAKGDWAAASRYFTRSETVLKVYPMELRLHFGLLAAETALNIGDVGLTKYHLDSLEALNPDRMAQAHIDYLRGRLLAKVLDPDGAAAVWKRAIEGPDRRIRVLATLARTDLLLEKGKITKKGAIDALEKLRFAWRGDDLEFRVLKRLGQAYIDADDYKNGLLTLRELATNFPKHPGVDSVIDTMRAAFVKLYVDGAADKLAPLAALAIYDQFRELTPEGPVGDTLISRLVERLVAVDLLDRAATLLRHLVDHRLHGTDRFDAANRLALVYLLDRKPQEAFDALAGQVPADIIPEAATTRRHLKARALADLARYQDGLALIKDDTSVQAETLRAEIYWKLRDWTNAALAYAKVVDDTVKDVPAGKNGGSGHEAALDENAQDNLMSLAIADALGRNQPALKLLRTRFLGRMAKTPFKELFEVVTAPSGNVPDDYRAIASKVAEVDQFQAFIKSYRDKLLNRGGHPAPAKAPAPPPSASAQGTPTQG